MNVSFFTGNVGKDAETRSTTSGEVLSFSVAVQQGSSRDAKSEWYRCSLWGQRGNSLKQHITKGAKVAVVGQLAIGEYDGKPQFNVNVTDIDPWCGGRRDDGKQEGGRHAGGGSSDNGGSFGVGARDSDFDDDLSDDVPFVAYMSHHRF